MTADAPGIIAIRIRELRLTYGLTQPEFAAQIGCCQGIVSLWESGGRQPLATSLIRICEAFGVASDWLPGLDDFEE